MRVRMKVSVSGVRNGVPWPGIGDEMDVPDGEGADLCAAGLAEPVAAEKPAEKAVDERPVDKRDDDKSGDDDKPSAVTTESGPTRRRGRQ